MTVDVPPGGRPATARQTRASPGLVRGWFQNLRASVDGSVVKRVDVVDTQVRHIAVIAYVPRCLGLVTAIRARSSALEIVLASTRRTGHCALVPFVSKDDE